MKSNHIQSYHIVNPSLWSLIVLMWKSLTCKPTFKGHHTDKVQKDLRLGISLFIVSEILFFFRLLLDLFSF